MLISLEYGFHLAVGSRIFTRESGREKELVDLLCEYVDLIQNVEPLEQLPVVLFVGGSKNMQTFLSGTDLIEFILAASYLERELVARNINVKVAPAYDLGTGNNGSTQAVF